MYFCVTVPGCYHLLVETISSVLTRCKKRSAFNQITRGTFHWVRAEILRLRRMPREARLAGVPKK